MTSPESPRSARQLRHALIVEDSPTDAELMVHELRRCDTYLGLNMSRYAKGVAKRHGQISRLMFAGYPVDAITNGVHAATWTSPHFQALYDRHIPDWRQDNFSYVAVAVDVG